MANKNPIKSAVSSPTIADSKKTIKPLPWSLPVNGLGYTLGGSAVPTSALSLVPDQTTVRYLQPYGTRIPTKKLDRTTGYSQVANLSHNFDLQKVQAAFRSAESGDTRLLFTYYRDFFLGNAQIVSELSKRKLATLSVPFTILPFDKTNKDDVKAAKVIEFLLKKYPDFNRSLIGAMNAIVYPVSVLEKTFESIEENKFINENPYDLRYCIKELHPVDYNLVSYRLPYVPQSTGHSMIQGKDTLVQQPQMVTYNLVGIPEDVIYDVDTWEPNLRFWQVLPNGVIINTPATMISPDPYRHIVHRSDLLNGIARENFGGLGKSLLFLSIMSQLGLDVFLRCMQKYGMPLIISKVDTSQVDTVEKIMEAFGNAHILNAVAVNKDAEIQIEEMNYAGAADGHTKFLEFINNQISLLISGQTLSSNAQSTGLGSGTANLHAAVREDIIQFDRLCLANMLQTQLFPQLLEINGIKGNIPSIIWGQSASSTETVQLSNTLNNLKLAGIKPSEESLNDLSIKFGFQLEFINNSMENKPLNDKPNAKNKLVNDQLEESTEPIDNKVEEDKEESNDNR